MKDFEQWYNDKSTREMLDFYDVSKEAAQYIWSSAKVSTIHTITEKLLS